MIAGGGFVQGAKLVILIEITVYVRDDEMDRPQGEAVGVVQLPFVPVDGMLFMSPSDPDFDMKLSDVMYDFRKQMLTGALADIANDDEIDRVIKGWEDIGFAWKRHVDEDSTE